MADARDAAGARQLGQGAADRLPLGLRLQRARRAAGLHRPERSLAAAARARSRHERHPRLPGGGARLRRLVARAPAADVQALARGRAATRSAGPGPTRHADRRRSRSASSSRWSARSSRSSPAPTSCAWSSRTGGRCRCRGSSGSTPACWSLAQRRAANARARARTASATSARVRLSLATGGRRDARLPRRAARRLARPRRQRLPRAGNPANSFFYLLTGLHGLHILGGLVALARDRRPPPGARATPDSSGSGSSSAPPTGTSCCWSGSACWSLLHRLGDRLRQHLPRLLT